MLSYKFKDGKRSRNAFKLNLTDW